MNKLIAAIFILSTICVGYAFADLKLRVVKGIDPSSTKAIISIKFHELPEHIEEGEYYIWRAIKKRSNDEGHYVDFKFYKLEVAK